MSNYRYKVKETILFLVFTVGLSSQKASYISTTIVVPEITVKGETSHLKS